jgi:hypothetical protein
MGTFARFRRQSRFLVAFGVLIVLLVWRSGASGPVQAQQAVRIIWLHHSCGQNLIDQGNVRQGLTALGYEFYDHGYNEEGLRLADGSYAGYNYDVPGDNTDPDGFATIFSQPLHDPPDNTFSQLMQYDVIAFKSCFPTSNIGSEDHLAEYQAYYRTIRDQIAQHPDKLFITVTQPPQVPGASDSQEAARARALANWLQSDEYLGLPNLVTFDFFGYLAGEDHFLRPEYRMDEYDAHPNERANREIGPHFVSFVDQAIRAYGVTPGPPPAAPHPTATTEPSQPPSTPQQIAGSVAPAGSVVDDFESGNQGWHADHDHTGSSVACAIDTEMAHGGASALRAEYSIASGGWGGCMLSFEPLRDWSAGSGLALWIRSDAADQQVGLMVFSGDPNAPSPFETFFLTTGETAGGWTRLVFLWSDIGQAQWADASNLPELDPTRIISFGLGLGLDEAHREGILWVDDVQLLTDQPETAEPTPLADTTATAEVVVLTGEPSSAGEKTSGGICPLAALLPLGVAVVVIARRRF